MKTVFITGGSRGIGAYAVSAFAALGYNVAFTYLNSEKEALSLSADNVLPIKADMAESKQVSLAVKCATERFGSVDILINNVGIDEFSLFTDITDEMWKRMIDNNLSSAFFATREILPYMISKKSGSIINISSMWGQVGASCEVHYSVSKSGLIGLTKALAKEVGPSGIRVNCIAPGVIDTDMNRCLTNEDIEQLKRDTPLGKIGTVQDVFNSILFLSEDTSSFITGQILGLSGGYVI